MQHAPRFFMIERYRYPETKCKDVSRIHPLLSAMTHAFTSVSGESNAYIVKDAKNFTTFIIVQICRKRRNVLFSLEKNE